jgi:hypothetical protein
MNTLLWRDKCNFVQQMIAKFGVVWEGPKMMAIFYVGTTNESST